MTINKYFGNQIGVASEQNLVEDLIIEMIQLAGRDFIYIPRTTNNIDQVLNEAPNASFESFKVIEGYVQNYNDFSANPLLMTQFGIQSNGQLDLIISK